MRCIYCAVTTKSRTLTRSWLRIECVERLGETAGDAVWRRFNDLFEWLPLAAVIEDRICCMHGGIGRSLTHISQINDLKRPLNMENGGVELMDILWSDPTENDGVEGLRPNARGPGLVTFGPDRVKAFCETNGIHMIVQRTSASWTVSSVSPRDSCSRFSAPQTIAAPQTTPAQSWS